MFVNLYLEMFLLAFIPVDKLAILVRHIVALLPLHRVALGVRDLDTALEWDFVAFCELLFDVSGLLYRSAVGLG